MLTEGARAIDWAILLVDFLVLAVIIGLEAPGFLHKRRVRRVLLKFEPLIQRGETLQREIPEPAPPYGSNRNDPLVIAKEAEVEKWIETVRNWNQEMASFLATYPRAAMVFNHKSDPPPQGGTLVYRGDSRYAFAIHGYQREIYLRLETELTNLYRVAESPEAYF